MNLVRDVLDKRLVGHGHDPMGMADGLIIEVRENQPPRVAAIESGMPVLARRIHPSLGRAARALGRRFGIRRGSIYRIPWKRVKSVGIEIELDLDADRTPAKAWDHWLRQHVVRHIPGSGA
jgi:hypothetical protein